MKAARIASPSSQLPASRKRVAMRLVLLVVAGYVAFSYARIRLLIRKSQPLFQQSNRFERDYFVGNSDDPPDTFVVMGDSTAVGYGTDRLEQTCAYQVARAWAETGRYVHVINIAVSGARLRNVVEEQLPQLSKLQPYLITISVGANDSTHGPSRDEYEAQLAALVGGLRSSAAKVLIANTPDMYQVPALPLPMAMLAGFRAQRQNQLLTKALLSTDFHIVDLYNEGKLIYHRDKKLYAVDLFHPSAAGYRVWAEMFMKGLNRLTS